MIASMNGTGMQAFRWVAAAGLMLAATNSHGAVVGRAVSATGDLNLTTFNVDADGDTFPSQNRDGDAFNEGFTALGDMFGLGRRGLVSNQNPLSAGDPALDGQAYPFAVLDDSMTFTTDVIGIVRGGVSGAITDTDPFFGVSDTVNLDTGEGAASAIQTATWLFNVAGSSGALTIKADMAAMGDFESTVAPADIFDFEVSLDGGAFAPLFTSSVDDPTNLMQNYTLENPNTAVQTLTDPLLMDGTALNNIFQTFSKSVGAATNTVTVRFTGRTDGGSEAFAFRNLIIEDSPVISLLGDYNNNGAVDAADYVLWRNGGPLQNEGDNPGTVDAGDYTFWRAHFGEGTAGAVVGLGNVSVPEPASALLIAICGLAIGGFRRAR